MAYRFSAFLYTVQTVLRSSLSKNGKEKYKRYYDILNSLGLVISFSLLTNEQCFLPQNIPF